MVTTYTDLLDFFSYYDRKELRFRDFKLLLQAAGMDKEYNHPDTVRTSTLSMLKHLENCGLIERRTKQPKHVFILTEKGISFLAAKKLRLILLNKAGFQLGRIT